MKYLFIILSSFALIAGGCVADQTTADREAGRQEGGRELDLSNRGLQRIPSDVFTRTELERLDLSNNRLTGAPQAEIRNLQRLIVLDLSGNDLTGLPAEFGQLKNLQTLDVSDNQLTGLPLELGNLTQLRVLDLRGNPYSEQDLEQIAAKLPNTEIQR